MGTNLKKPAPDAIPDDFAEYIGALMGDEAAKAAREIAGNKPAPKVAERSAQPKKKQVVGFTTSSQEIGKNYPDKGIYFGIWVPKTLNGRACSRSFNMYSMPMDLNNELTYDQNMNEYFKFQNLLDQNFYGHKYETYKSERELYNALLRGKYNGGWFIPTSNMIASYSSIAPNDRQMPNGNMYSFRQKGDLAKIFAERTYFTCEKSLFSCKCVDMKDGSVFDAPLNSKHYIRMVRAVERSF